ncbi:MAG: ammonium transporter [Candidatus Omnitrophota bacterium]
MRGKRSFFGGSLVLFILLGISRMAWAEGPEVPDVSAGDISWVLVSAALVFLMTPGLAFFYGGLVRRKNMLSILMQCFMLICIITLQWVLFGYSLAFGPDVKGLIGSLGWAGLQGVGLDPFAPYSATIPHQLFMIYQAMFAIITPGLILGAFAERMKFSSFCVFSLLWATFVYDPVCHWIWGVGGFLRNMGMLDFAGGAVVHINAGIAALVCAIMLGKRRGYPTHMSPPHNLPFAVLGAGLLWFGWFGFNGGSALGANRIAVSAMVVSHIAGAAAGLTWALLEWKFNSKPTMLGMITGAVAGLATITPAAGFVGPVSAIWIGILASGVCFFFVAVVKTKFGYDDSLDAFGVHGVGGILGTLATGLWASKAVNPAGNDGLFFGNPELFLIQAKGTIITIVYSFIVSWVLLKLVDVVMGLRVSDDEERIGLDLTQHRESGYTMVD